ncbi:MAG: hypothetical protein LBI55_01055 [Oscillospiraceae bacterium]|jgi:hypothetical protein|nr:hypothetical protein [Oscillospiraceae bacterium]
MFIKDLADIMERSSRKNNSGGICASVILLGLATAIYALYKTTEVDCKCHLRCRGKFCNCDFNKDWKNSPSTNEMNEADEIEIGGES